MALLPNGDYPPPRCTCPGDRGRPCFACQAHTHPRSVIQQRGAQKRWADFHATSAAQARLAAYQDQLAALQPTPRLPPQGQRVSRLRQHITKAAKRLQNATTRLAVLQQEAILLGDIPPPPPRTGPHPHRKAIRKLQRRIKTEQLRLAGKRGVATLLRPSARVSARKRKARKLWDAFYLPEAVRARLEVYQAALALLHPSPLPHPHAKRLRQVQQSIIAETQRVETARAKLATFTQELTLLGGTLRAPSLPGKHPHAAAIRKLRRQIKTEEQRLAGTKRTARK